jgi:Ca2+/H+ antiporter, TMEM165/GDT1 family
MQTLKEVAGVVALWMLVIFGLGVVFAGVEMWLWNQVMPALFGLKEMTFWQALFISWLSAMLIRGVPAYSSSRSEEHLEQIKRLSARQEMLLEQISDLQDRQLGALDEMKSSLQDIGNTLERSR